MDKRPFLAYLNNLKDKFPSDISLIESIQDSFDGEFPAISDAQKMALRLLPEQFTKRIPLDNHEWTTQLHIWGEQCVPELLKLSPVYMAFKNSRGDSVLMSLMAGATGAFREKVDYDLIKKILDTDFDYEESEKDKLGNDIIVIRSALDEEDLNDQTPIDYLIDFAYSNGQYSGHEPDYELIDIIENWVREMAVKNMEPVIDQMQPQMMAPEIVSTEIQQPELVGASMMVEEPDLFEPIEELTNMETNEIVEEPLETKAVIYIDNDKSNYPEEIYMEPYATEVKIGYIPEDGDDEETIFDLLRRIRQ